MYMCISVAEDVSSKVDPFPAGSLREVELPNWADAFKKVVLVQPFIGSFERGVFSTFNNIPTVQSSALEDYVEPSCYSITNLESFLSSFEGVHVLVKKGGCLNTNNRE